MLDNSWLLAMPVLAAAGWMIMTAGLSVVTGNSGGEMVRCWSTVELKGTMDSLFVNTSDTYIHC